MNQSKYIQELLDKYWEGETSLKEEKMLQVYFEGENIPAEFKAFQPLFKAKIKSQEAKLSDGFEAMILADIEAKENIIPLKDGNNIVQTQNAEIRKLRWLAGIAAGIALLLSVYIAMPKDSFNEFAFNAESELSEADHKKALKAYAQTKSALLFVSQKMNEGATKAAESLNKVPDLDKTINELE